MVDRILHIGHKFSSSYSKEVLQRAAEVYIYKGPKAVVPHLTEQENMNVAEAEALAQKIDAELRQVNRNVLLQYGVITVIFLALALAGFFSRSYVFAAVFAVPVLLLLRSLFKFVRRNPF